MLGRTWSWPLADRQKVTAGQPWGTGTLVSCRAGRQGGKELRELVPRREQPMHPPHQPLSQCIAWHSASRVRMPVCVCAVEPEPVPSLSIPGLTHQGGLPLADPCQGTQVRGREGAALVATTACAVSLVSWHTVSYCSFQLRTPSSSAERTQMERQWWRVEDSKTAPCQSQSREQ